ncbi:MAG: amidohydrolase family protein [Acidobacteria bacterium]|nr:amidohydrolase family protein [Acidobacteriota bacterium]
MKIDAYNHILPGKYKQACLKAAPPELNLEAFVEGIPALWDLSARFKIMDMFEEYVQVLALAHPPLEMLAAPEGAAVLARLANDEMAELVAKYPTRFLAAIAALPMNNVDEALKETERAIEDLGLKGVQIFTPTGGRALDAPEFLPIFEKMAEYDLPILLHPARDASFIDYPAEKESRYQMWRTLGWPYDTAVAMTRLVCTGLFEKYPNLKILTHHLGGIVPYLEQRIREGFDKMEKTPGGKALFQKLSRHPHDFLSMFHADTVTTGSAAALECGLKFFGEDRVLFATDMPFDTVGGSEYVAHTIGAITQMKASQRVKRKIYHQNARRLFQL